MKKHQKYWHVTYTGQKSSLTLTGESTVLAVPGKLNLVALKKSVMQAHGLSSLVILSAVPISAELYRIFRCTGRLE